MIYDAAGFPSLYMAQKSPRIKFLTGTPLATELDWTEKNLLSDFLPAVRRYLGLESLKAKISTNSGKPKEATVLPNWRSLPLRTSHGQPDDEYVASNAKDAAAVLPAAAALTSFGSTIPSFDGSVTQEEWEQHEFLERSFHVHEGPPSSPPDDSDCTDAALETTLMSFTSTVTSFSQRDSFSSQASIHSQDAAQSGLVGPFSQLGSLIPLSSLPKATHLHALYPQAPTVNLVVGVISVALPRQVVIRRTGHNVELVELIVGDDTRAGFTLSIWLAPVSPKEEAQRTTSTKETNGNPGHDLRCATEKVRNGDVLLVRNVGLAAWRQKVYGQNLRRRAGRSETFIHILGETEVELQPHRKVLADRIEKVRNWVTQFVGPRTGFVGKGRPSETSMATRGDLPPDTQPDN